MQTNCGQDYSLCLCENGLVYSFGGNSHGQLGLGNNTNYNSPQKIESLQDIDFVECGAKHVFSKNTNNVVYCWGFNGFGQLGIKTDSIYSYNIPFLSLVLSMEDIIDIKCS